MTAQPLARRRIACLIASAVAATAVVMVGFISPAAAEAPAGQYALLKDYPPIGCLAPTGTEAGSPINVDIGTCAELGHWKFIDVGHGRWQVESVDIPGMCIDSAAPRMTAGTQLVIRPCHPGKGNQSWRPEVRLFDTSGLVVFHSRAEGLCWSAPLGDVPTPVTLQPCAEIAMTDNIADPQVFVFVPYA